MARAAMAALAKVLVTTVLLWLVLGSVGVDALARAFARTDPVMLMLALCVLLVQFFVATWRWQALLHLLFGKRVSLAPLALSIGQGMLASQALPATVGGDAYRMALISGEVGAGAAVRSVLCDRVLGLVLLVGLTVALLPLMVWRLGSTPAVVSVAAASVTALLGFVALLALAGPIARLPFFGAPLSTVAHDLRRALGGGGESILANALGVATHLLGIALIFVLGLSIKASISLLDCLLIVPPVLLVSALPVSLGGWGIRESAFLAGFAMVGVDAADSVAVSILFGATGILLGAVSALLAARFSR
jgi:hypothetical protein